jgi:putative oxidoreductase
MKNSATLLFARLMMGWIFIPSGISKLLGNATTAAYIDNTAGLPFASLLGWGTGLFEVSFGLAIIVGFQTAKAGIALSVFCVAAAFLFHAGKGTVPGLSEDAVRLISELHFYMVFKNISMAGGLLALALHGAGDWSVDAKRMKREAKSE